MMSCIFVLYIALLHADVAPRSTFAAATAGHRDADARAAAGIERSRRALREARPTSRARSRRQTIWAARLRAEPEGLRVRLEAGARATTGLAVTRPTTNGVRFLERGIAAGRTAVALEPNRPEGHFWIAANMGALAESFGLRQGLKYRGEIRDELRRRCGSTRRSSRDRPTARSAAGITRCRASSAAATQEVRRAPAAVADLQPEQHRLALLPRRGPDRDQA